MGNTISRKEAIAAFEGTYTQLRFKMESYNGYHDYSEPIVRTANELVQLTYQADYIEALQNIPIEDFAGYYEMVKRLVNKLELAGKEYFNTHEVITATNLSGVLAETEKVERMVEILNELEPKDMVHLEYQEKRNAIQFIMTNWGVFDAEEQAIIKLLHALSAGDIPLFISDLLNNEGRLLRSLTTRIDGPEKTALFGWFDSMLKEQQSAPPLLIDENYEIGRGSLVDGRVSLNLLNLDNAETRTEIIHPFRYVEYKYHGENISVPAVSFVGEFGGDDDFLYDYKYKEGVDYTNLSDEEKDALFREFVIHYLPGGFLEQLGSPLQIIIGVILVIFLGGYLASFKVFLLALDIGSIAIEGYLGIQIIIKALEMKDTATSVRQLKLSAQYFAYGAAKLTMQVVDALLTFGDMVKTKKPDIEVDVVQRIPDNSPSLKSSETFSNWNDMRAVYEGNVTRFLQENKPLGSPVPRNWFDKGGLLRIDTLENGSQVWHYKLGNVEVSYMPPEGHPDFGNYLHPKNEIANFSIGEPTGSRNGDIAKAMEYLRQKGFNEVPEGYIIHHDTEPGSIQLVREDVHTEFSHYGGYSFNRSNGGD